MSIHRRLLILSVMTLSLASPGISSAVDLATFEAYENACVKGAGTSHRVSLRILLRRHADKKKLLPKFEDMDSDKFCDCTFRKFESLFGKDNYVKFRDFRASFAPPGMTHAQADQAISQVYLTCFGEQIGRSDLKPSK